MKQRSLAALLLFLSTTAAEAQVLITEVQPNPLGTTSDGAEWIEIHNTGTGAVNIGGWHLTEYAGGAVFDFPTNTMLAAGQVIVVTVNSVDFTVMALAANFPVTVASFELAEASNDPLVPDLTESTSGSFALANGGGGVLLLDNNNVNVSWADWGSPDRAEIPGTPISAPGDGSSISRIANTGSSNADYAVIAVPTPGTGFGGVVPTVPLISNPVRAPAAVVFGANFSVSATVTDSDGIGGVELYLATSTATTGNAAGAYVAVAAANTAGDNWRASGVVNSLITFPAPTGFSDRYVRYFLYALDNQADDAELPLGAVTTPENAAFFWENVLPANTVFSLAEVREQDARELPVWDGHSVRVEGVALTARESFLGGATNFFIASTTGVDAIRVFDDVLIPTNVAVGDMVRVTGKVAAFRGVRQIGRDERTDQPEALGSELEVQVIGTAPVPVVTTNIVNLLAAGEQNESQLVQIGGVMLVPNPANGDPVPATWAGNTTLFVDDGTGTLPVRVASFIDLADTPTPTGMFDLRGIFTQFAPAGTGGYQLQPRALSDVVGGGPPVDGGVSDSGAGSDGGAGDDTGTGGMDATPGMDARVDSGVDSGTGADAAGGDTGMKDAGFFGTDREDGNCGCSTTRGHGRTSSAGVAVFGFLALLGLWRHRRGVRPRFPQ